MFSRLLRSRAGFTLPEVLITVGIVGTLSAVGIVSFREYSKKAKQSEAKSNLSGLFTAMKTYVGEYGVQNPRFDATGFRPDGTMNFRVGFAGDTPQPLPATAAARGTATCINTWASAAECVAGFKNWNEGALVTANLPSAPAFPYTAFVGRKRFTAYAVGYLAGTQLDTWSIDENRTLNNPVSGL